MTQNPKLFTLLILLSTLSFAQILGAKASSTIKKQQTDENYYGVIDMQRIILTVEDGKNARSDLEKMIKESQFKVDSLPSSNPSPSND